MSSSKMDHRELQRRLKEDEVAMFFTEIKNKVKMLYTDYGRQTILVICLVVAVLLANHFWKAKKINDFEASQRLYSNAVAFVQQSQYQDAINDLGTLLDDYSSSQVSAIAMVMRGNCYAQIGEYDLALTDYQAVVSKIELEDSSMVRLSMVQTLRSLDKPDDALQELVIVEKQVKSPVLQEQIFYLRGCCYEDKNDVDQALKAYKSIPSKSKLNTLASDRISILEAQAVAPINP